MELAKMTAHLRALTILDFSFNVIGSDGAKVLGECVYINSKVILVDLRT